MRWDESEQRSKGQLEANRTPWTAKEMQMTVEMRAQGYTYEAISLAMGTRKVTSIRDWVRKHISQDQRDSWPTKRGVAAKRLDGSTYTPAKPHAAIVPPEVIAERDAAFSYIPTITQELMGDPAPRRSALGRSALGRAAE